jgi:hypothetical protein
LQARDMINTDAQDLGVRSRKLSQIGFVCRDLARSNRCPGKREKRQHHDFIGVLA